MNIEFSTSTSKQRLQVKEESVKRRERILFLKKKKKKNIVIKEGGKRYTTRPNQKKKKSLAHCLNLTIKSKKNVMLMNANT